MRILQVQQGSDSWRAERACRFTASEAPSMMGASKFTSRSDLLRHKATGIAPEVSPQKQALFDKGHAAEAAAREILEEMIGEALFPATGVHDTDDRLLASLDGMTMAEDRIAEHKLWSDGLAAQVQAGDLEPHYFWQLEHQLLVSGAEVCIFVCSDGTREKFVHMEYRPVPGRREALLAGWAQFEKDLAAFDPVQAAPAVPAAVAAPIEALPAVSVRMDGALAVVSNLGEFGAALRAFVAKIPAKPTTDVEFADAEAACKALKRAEEALDGAEANALGQVRSVEDLTRTISDLRNVARTARLASERMVKARKEQIRTEEVQRGRAALVVHLQGLNRTLGGGFMPDIPADFAGVISGKKTLDSLRNAIDTELARAKIAANEIAQRVQTNLNTLRENAEHKHLFPDVSVIVQKASEDFQALIDSRIAAEQRRLEAERDRIRAEEEARAAEKLRQEQAAREAEERRQREEAQAAIHAQARAEKEAQDAEERRQQAALAESLHREVPAPVTNVLPMPTKAPAGPPTLKLGDINRHLAPLSVTAEGLRALGFEPAGRDRAAVLFHPADLPYIITAAIQHLTKARDQIAEAA